MAASAPDYTQPVQLMTRRDPDQPYARHESFTGGGETATGRSERLIYNGDGRL